MVFFSPRTFMLTYAHIERASQRIAGVAHRTPVATSRTLNAMLGCEVFMKCENLQRMGAFKFRGAYNAISALTEEERMRGICAFSSGNHAQAVALASSLHGTKAVIVMPADAPQLKLDATRGYGAEVITYDRYTEDREAITLALQKERGMSLIPPYDHYEVMAGQGTMAKELIEDVGTLDAFIGCTSGGGLIAGCSTAVKHLNPAAQIFGSEPEAGNDTLLSLRKGERITDMPVPNTICDGQQTPAPGKLTFEVNKRNLTDVLLTSDAMVVEAMKFAFERLKLVLEPSGANALASLMTNKERFRGQRVGVTLSGGNVGLARFIELVQAKQ
jgi:threo-3-hydroxy-L-aspartate ammonia-lyase